MEAGLMVSGLILFIAVGAVMGLALGRLTNRQGAGESDVVDQVNALLPQTQCAQCGYPGCRPYAQAVVDGQADINQCPPGGEAGVVALANLLGREPKPINPDNGLVKPPQVAIVREDRCIGCTLCIQACPVDAILGAAQQMHTVIASECTGCELCLPPCPVDCIDLVAPSGDPRTDAFGQQRVPLPGVKLLSSKSR